MNLWGAHNIDISEAKSFGKYMLNVFCVFHVLLRSCGVETQRSIKWAACSGGPQ